MPAKDDLIILEKRFGLKNVITTGEAASAAREAANEFPDAINKIMEEKRCLPEQVFSADTSSPVLEKMPQRTCISGDETRAPGPKADGQAHSTALGKVGLPLSTELLSPGTGRAEINTRCRPQRGPGQGEPVF